MSTFSLSSIATQGYYIAGMLQIAVMMTFSSLAHAAISGSDDFNDNSKSNKWGSDRLSANAVMTETSKRLQFTSSSLSSQVGYRPWISNQATYDTNWELIIDLSNTSSLSTSSAYSSMGFEIFSPGGYTKSLYFGLYAATDNGPPAERGFESGMMMDDNEYGYQSTITGSTAAAIRITFDATTKVLTCYMDADGSTGGYTWTRHASYGIKNAGGTTTNRDWGMTGSDAFQVSIFGYCQNHLVSAGSLFADNFSASSSLTAITTPASSVTESTATLNASVFTNGSQSTVTFQYSKFADFSTSTTTTGQSISGSNSISSVSKSITGLMPGTTYYVRASATGSSGTVMGNTLAFATPPYQLAIESTGGTVSLDPAQASYPAGANVTLTATPASGKTFLGWTGDLSGLTNPASLTMNQNKSVTAHFTIDLIDALQSSNLTFTTGGNANWYGQKIVTRDSSGSPQSGKITNSQQSWLQTSVRGPGKLDFWWKVSSETADYLEFYIDGVRQVNRISGKVDWTMQSYDITSGTHTLRWRYVKDFIFTENDDTAWVDGIVWTPGLTGFSLWLTQKFSDAELADPAISANNADPDGDGVANILEYAFGGNPKVSSTTELPVGQLESVDGETYLTLTVIKPPYANDVIYTPQVSSEMKDWFSGAVHTTVMIDTSTTLKVRDNLSVQPGRRRFMRVEVVVP